MTEAAPRLLVLRHAHSSWALPGQRDHQRPLDERGRGDVARLAAEMIRSGLGFDVVISSTATRAQETLAGLLAHPGVAAPSTNLSSDDLYALGPEAYFAAVRDAPSARCLLLVGHNPMVEAFSQTLAPEGEPEALARLMEGFPTAGLAVIQLTEPFGACAPGTGVLKRLVIPRDLA